MIPPISQPSNPSYKIRLRKALLSEAIDFAGVDSAKEEGITTMFLNKTQEKDTYTDSALWTGEDRRFVIFWAWIHTESDTYRKITFPCSCGSDHDAVIDLKLIGERYTKIKGKPERDDKFMGEDITVRPLNGIDLEELEMMRIPIAEYHRIYEEMSDELLRLQKLHGLGKSKCNDQEARIEDYSRRKGPLSGPYQQRMMQIKTLSTALSVSFASIDAEHKSDKARRKAKNLKIENMPLDHIWQLREVVERNLADMKHGLDCELEDGRLYVLTPELQCPMNPEVKPRRRLPFRNLDYLSVLFR
jgi:hypothetical protein